MDTYRQVFGNNRTRTLLRCASGVDEHHRPTSIRSFVGGELDELTPSHISNAPADCLVSVDLHLLNVKVFKGNELVFVDQLARFLVRKVAPSIGRTFVGMARA